MRKMLLFVVATIFVIGVVASKANGWHHTHHRHYRRTYQSYTIKNPQRLKECQATCQQKYGVDGAKCRDMDTDAKKTCRQNNRSCNAKCWNKYH